MAASRSFPVALFARAPAALSGMSLRAPSVPLVMRKRMGRP